MFQTDLPITQICPPAQPLTPLTQSLISTSQSQICLSLAILLFPCIYLLYKHIHSLYTLYTKCLLYELDNLDISLVVISILRLIVFLGFVFMGHDGVGTVLNIAGGIWVWALMLVYFRFVTERGREWGTCVGVSLLVYAIVLLGYNWGQGVFVVPLFYPLLVVTLFIVAIAIFQFHKIRQAITFKTLSDNMLIELYNRRSFIFQTSTISCVSLIFLLFSDTLKPIVGVVLFYCVVDFFGVWIVYRCILARILRRNELHMGEDDGIGGRVSDGLIVVEMMEVGKFGK